MSLSTKLQHYQTAQDRSSVSLRQQSIEAAPEPDTENNL
jgi:hypothetical protein